MSEEIQKIANSDQPKQETVTTIGNTDETVNQALIDINLNIDDEMVQVFSNLNLDNECQVEIFHENSSSGDTFVCNRHIYSNQKCDAEIQTAISNNTQKIVIPNKKAFEDKSCNIPEKTFADTSIQCD